MLPIFTVIGRCASGGSFLFTFRVRAKRSGPGPQRLARTLNVNRSTPITRQPAVVGFHEIPDLLGSADLDGVQPDVLDVALEVSPRVEKALPPRSFGPDRVRWRPQPCFDQRGACPLLKPFDHQFGLVSMAADQQMDMIGHDRAG